MDNTIIVRRPTTDEENAIGASLNGISMAMNVLLESLSKSDYLKKDPTRFMALFGLHKTILDAEADFFGFMSWDDLVKWQNIHGNILGKIEL